jgi:hypothetical protein
MASAAKYHQSIPESKSSAEYIALMSTELARLARSAKLDMLAYLLEIARLEAETACRCGE